MPTGDFYNLNTNTVCVSSAMIYSSYLPLIQSNVVGNQFQIFPNLLEENWPGHEFHYGQYISGNSHYIIIDRTVLINFTIREGESFQDVALGTVGEYFMRTI